ncbi:MAG TPA: thioredoxin domain-containing protein [Vicinamibacterales bacterium]|nr:thioredoxin domain-containing protein [Vicinamibacterales bacterium]
MLSARARSWLDIVTTIAMVLTCAALFWAAWTAPRPVRRPVPSVPATPVSLEGAEVQGDRTARVVIIEYADFQCPYCGAFERSTMPLIRTTYVIPGKVLFAFRHRPIHELHPMATRAAQFAECAGKQGKFWEMERALFDDQRNLTQLDLLRHAESIGLDLPALSVCASSDDTVRAVSRDVEEAKTLGLSGTPAFLIGRRDGGRVVVAKVLSGAASFPVFRAAIDGLLADGNEFSQTQHIIAWSGVAIAVLAAAAGLVVVRIKRSQGAAVTSPRHV